MSLGMYLQGQALVMGYREKRAEDPTYKKYDGHKFDITMKFGDKADTYELTIPFDGDLQTIEFLRSKVDSMQPVSLVCTGRVFKGSVTPDVIVKTGDPKGAASESKTQRAAA